MSDVVTRKFRMPSVHDKSSVDAFADPDHERVWLSISQHLRRKPEDRAEDHEVCQALTREAWHHMIGMLMEAGNRLGWLPHPPDETTAPPEPQRELPKGRGGYL